MERIDDSWFSGGRASKKRGRVVAVRTDQRDYSSRTRDPYSGAAHGQKVHIRVDFLTNFS
jgi:hypothetical protein